MTGFYFFSVRTYTGNNLTKEAGQYAYTFDRCVVSEEYLPTFERDMEDKLAELNDKYHRSMPLKFDKASIQEGFFYDASNGSKSGYYSFTITATKVEAFYN